MTNTLPDYMPEMGKLVTALNLNLATGMLRNSFFQCCRTTGFVQVVTEVLEFVLQANSEHSEICRDQIGLPVVQSPCR